MLSSTWRLHEIGIVALMRGLERVGIDAKSIIVGSTPAISGGRRAHEIGSWLDSYGPCAAWAAVDDLDLWSEDPTRMNRHAVKTSLSTGLQQAAAQEVVGILRDDAAAPLVCESRDAAVRMATSVLRHESESAPRDAGRLPPRARRGPMGTIAMAAHAGPGPAVPPSRFGNHPTASLEMRATHAAPEGQPTRGL